MSDAERLAHLEARVEALSATLKTVLSTLVLRGVLTKPAVDAIVAEAEAMVQNEPDAVSEVESVRVDMPKIIRAAMGPEPDDDDHDH